MITKQNNKRLDKARKKQNDEHYTTFFDINRELKYYKIFLKNKIIYLPFDDLELMLGKNAEQKMSQFWIFFHKNFKELGLKKLIATSYRTDRPTYKNTYEGGDDQNVNVYKKEKLKQNGNFLSPEIQNILKEVDIVVSNPPFSIFVEKIIPLIKKANKKFIFIANQNIIHKKNIFPHLKKREWRIGFTRIKFFLNKEGKWSDNVGDITRWFTNLPIETNKSFLKLEKKYSKLKYFKYDDYDAINVEKTKDIPGDYDGLIGVPITFFDYWNPQQFKIIGLLEYWDLGKQPFINKKQEYARIIIKKI